MRSWMVIGHGDQAPESTEWGAAAPSWQPQPHHMQTLANEVVRISARVPTPLCLLAPSSMPEFWQDSEREKKQYLAPETAW
jgi:hypothetical protein